MRCQYMVYFKVAHVSQMGLLLQTHVFPCHTILCQVDNLSRSSTANLSYEYRDTSLRIEFEVQCFLQLLYLHQGVCVLRLRSTPRNMA